MSESMLKGLADAFNVVNCTRDVVFVVDGTGFEVGGAYDTFQGTFHVLRVGVGENFSSKMAV